MYLVSDCTHSVHPSPSFQQQLFSTSLQWRHNERDGVSNHQPYYCLLNHLFRRRSKKTSKIRVIGLCEGNSPVTGEFTAQRTSNAENVSIWLFHHDFPSSLRRLDRPNNRQSSTAELRRLWLDEISNSASYTALSSPFCHCFGHFCLNQFVI